MPQFSTLLTLFCALCVSAAPAVHKVAHEKRDILPSSWSKTGRVHGDVTLPVRIGLTQSNLDQGHELLSHVSSPDSPRYGKYYTAEEVADIFAPASHAVDAVRNWLSSAGMNLERVSQSTNKQWLQFDATAKEVEALLQTEYHYYEHAATGQPNIACEK